MKNTTKAKAKAKGKTLAKPEVVVDGMEKVEISIPASGTKEKEVKNRYFSICVLEDKTALVTYFTKRNPCHKVFPTVEKAFFSIRDKAKEGFNHIPISFMARGSQGYWDLVQAIREIRKADPANKDAFVKVVNDAEAKRFRIWAALKKVESVYIDEMYDKGADKASQLELALEA